MLFKSGKTDPLVCSFCKTIDKTTLHLFCTCTKAKLLWDQLKEFISNETLFIPSLMPQSAVLGHIDYLILMYEFYICITPETESI